MTRRECYETLGLPEGADLAEVKKAYRRLAFAWHPDLNPKLDGAAKKFQTLNEAYVLLSQDLENIGAAARAAGARAGGQADSKTREQAQRAYAKARKNFEKQSKEPEADAPGADGGPAGAPGGGKDKHDVLRDLLNDPFARRVFEDIYSHIRHEAGRGKGRGTPPPRPARAAPCRSPAVPKAGSKVAGLAGGVMDKFKTWVSRQIDDEQTMYLPRQHLVPGAKIRLQISHGLSGETKTIELTLPPEYTPDRPVRLKGLGRKLGSWRGDLYLRVLPKEE